MARKIITGVIIPSNDNLLSDDQAVIMPESSLHPETERLISEISSGNNIDDQTPEEGFSFVFTSGKNYDLDKIIASIRRDNHEQALIMKINLESEVSQAIIDRCIEELKNIYHAEELEHILDYQNVFNNYFENHIEEYFKEANMAGIMGELLISELQPKIEVRKSDISRYLLEDAPKSGKVKPILDRSETSAIWIELGDGDLSELEDNENLTYLRFLISSSFNMNATEFQTLEDYLEALFNGEGL